MVGFLNDVGQVNQDWPTAFVDECERIARLSAPARSADPVYVIVNVRGTVKLNNGFDVRYVQTSGGDVGGDEDVDVAASKLIERPFAVALVLVSVDNHAREVLVGKEPL